MKNAILALVIALALGGAFVAGSMTVWAGQEAPQNLHDDGPTDGK